MSSTLRIPAHKLYRTDDNEDFVLLPCVRVTPIVRPYLNGYAQPVEGKVEFVAMWQIIIGTEVFEIEPSNSKVVGELGQYTPNFIFNGFHNSCMRIADMLNIASPVIN